MMEYLIIVIAITIVGIPYIRTYACQYAYQSTYQSTYLTGLVRVGPTVVRPSYDGRDIRLY
jgi:hypothetical protein